MSIILKIFVFTKYILKNVLLPDTECACTNHTKKKHECKQSIWYPLVRPSNIAPIFQMSNVLIKSETVENIS